MSNLLRCRTLSAIAVSVFGALAASSAVAFQPGPAQDPFEILPPAEQHVFIDYTADHAASIALAEQMSSDLGGTWQVALWNQYSNTPRRVFGSGIELSPGGFGSALDLDRVARTFIGAHPEIFGVSPDELILYRAENALGKWVIMYQQTARGYRVQDAFVDLVFTDSGRLYSFGSSAYAGISIPPVPSISRESAVQIARNALPYDENSQMVGNPDVTIVLTTLETRDGESRMTFRLAHRTAVPTDQPYGLYESYVDAQTGAIIRRENQVENAYSGTVQGDVEIPGYCNGNTANTPYANMNVVITGVGTVVSDASGAFSTAGNTGPHPFTASFDGPVVNVNCTGCGGDAVFSGTIDPDVSEAVYFPSGTYRADERDCFYFINKTFDFIKQIDPTFAHAKVTANVNVAADCNANWGGTVLNFFRTGGGCHNTGEIGDVMAHEYGHCIQSQLMGGSQATQGLGEGNSDVAGTFIIDGSTIGIGFNEGNCVDGLSCPGASCRDCENTLQYPANVVGQPIHSAGRVICGVTWDMRQALEVKYGSAAGEIKAAEIWHYSRKMFGNPGMTQPDQVLAYFTINDNDGDLGNGTPDYNEICGAATAHGFSCPTITVGVAISHTPLGSTTNSATPYEVLATITTTAPPLDTDSLLVYYRVNGVGSYIPLLMTATANPNEYHAYIPAQSCGSSVNYYIFAKDTSGNTKTSPATAPAATHAFSILGTITVYSQNFETASDWTQDPSHTATTGAFVRIDPNATTQQPGDDTTPTPGIFGWITAQNSSDGVDDVDGGVAATRSPSLDLSAYTQVSMSLNYFHGQRDQGGDPTGDFFRIQLSNDGGTTYPVNIISTGDVSSSPTWKALSVDLDAAIALTNQVRIRFQAADGTTVGDLVEAGVDDILITACDPTPPPDSIPPTVTVIAPNGGEYIEKGTNYNILWTATDNVGVTDVDILLSFTSGGTYLTTIASGEPNDGTYTWAVGNPASSQDVRIKVVARDAALNSGEDESDADFTVGPAPSAAPSIALTAPNGGESIDASGTAPITWSASDDIGVTGVDILLSLDSGGSYPITIATGEADDGAYTWSVYDTSSTQARIRVVASDANFQTAADASDADFTITLAATGTDGVSGLPARLFLGPNIPEPFTSSTKVRFGIPAATRAELAIYSVEGRVVRNIESGALGAGIWERTWDGRDNSGARVPAGPYFLRLTTPQGTVSHRLTFIR